MLRINWSVAESMAAMGQSWRTEVLSGDGFVPVVFAPKGLKEYLVLDVRPRAPVGVAHPLVFEDVALGASTRRPVQSKTWPELRVMRSSLLT